MTSSTEYEPEIEKPPIPIQEVLAGYVALGSRVTFGGMLRKGAISEEGLDDWLTSTLDGGMDRLDPQGSILAADMLVESAFALAMQEPCLEETEQTGIEQVIRTLGDIADSLYKGVNGGDREIRLRAVMQRASLPLMYHIMRGELPSNRVEVCRQVLQRAVVANAAVALGQAKTGSHNAQAELRSCLAMALVNNLPQSGADLNLCALPVPLRFSIGPGPQECCPDMLLCNIPTRNFVPAKVSAIPVPGMVTLAPSELGLEGNVLGRAAQLIEALSHEAGAVPRNSTADAQKLGQGAVKGSGANRSPARAKGGNVRRSPNRNPAASVSRDGVLSILTRVRSGLAAQLQERWEIAVAHGSESPEEVGFDWYESLGSHHSTLAAGDWLEQAVVHSEAMIVAAQPNTNAGRRHGGEAYAPVDQLSAFAAARFELSLQEALAKDLDPATKAAGFMRAAELWGLAADRAAQDDPVAYYRRWLMATAMGPISAIAANSQIYSEFQAYRNVLGDLAGAFYELYAQQKTVDPAIQRLAQSYLVAIAGATVNQETVVMPSLPRQEGAFDLLIWSRADRSGYDLGRTARVRLGGDGQPSLADYGVSDMKDKTFMFPRDSFWAGFKRELVRMGAVDDMGAQLSTVQKALRRAASPR